MMEDVNTTPSQNTKPIFYFIQYIDLILTALCKDRWHYIYSTDKENESLRI